MQMIEVGVRNQNKVDGREVRDAEARTTKPLQYKQPPRKIGIDHYALSPNLYEEAGMADERDAQLTVGSETRFVSLTRPRSHGRMAHQASELRRALAQCRITESLLDHSVTGPGLTLAVLLSSS